MSRFGKGDSTVVGEGLLRTDDVLDEIDEAELRRGALVAFVVEKVLPMLATAVVDFAVLSFCWRLCCVVELGSRLTAAVPCLFDVAFCFVFNLEG